MQTLWIVSEGSPGHDSQSVGLGLLLADRLKLEVVNVKGRVNARGWQRALIKRRMGKAGRPLPQTVLDKYFQIEIPEDKPKPDLIISSGGKSVLCAKTWVQRFGAKFIYLGEQKRFPDAWFDVIVSPVADDARPNAIICEIVPTPVSPASVAEAAAGIDRPEGRLWTMVIGGRSRSQLFESADWSALAEGMNQLASRHGIRWLLTTSRRTGPEAETVLKQTLEPQHVADAIWWSEAPRRQLYAFLGMGEFAFVTLDSVTMISEAVASGRPVVSIPASQQQIPKESFLNGLYKSLIASRRMVSLKPTELAAFDPLATDFSILKTPILNQLVDQVVSRLGD